MAGRNDDAIRTFQQTLDLDPKYWVADKNLGTAFRKAGRHQDAIAAFEDALQINPTAADIYLDWARSYRATKQNDKVIEVAKKGIEAARETGDSDSEARLDALLRATQ
jgi:tetratricopeptide (TPR) repeat protein